jgi:hypothetical protein
LVWAVLWLLVVGLAWDLKVVWLCFCGIAFGFVAGATFERTRR